MLQIVAIGFLNNTIVVDELSNKMVWFLLFGFWSGLMV